MRKILSILLTFVFILTLTACHNKINNNKTDNRIDNKTDDSVYFVAKVVEITENTMLVEVTNKGNCGVQVGNLATVSTEKIAGIVSENPTMVTDNYVRVEFNGAIMESYPLQLGEIYRIDIINEDGVSVE